MSLLASLFGSSKKTTTTATTTNATQTTIDNTSGVYAADSNLDLSSYTDNRTADYSDRSVTDNRVTTIVDPSADALIEIAAFGRDQNERLLQSIDSLSRTQYDQTAYIFGGAVGAIERNTERLAENFRDAAAAVASANESDGAQVLSTVENLTKTVVYGLAAVAAFATLRG